MDAVLKEIEYKKNVGMSFKKKILIKIIYYNILYIIYNK